MPRAVAEAYNPSARSPSPRVGSSWESDDEPLSMSRRDQYFEDSGYDETLERDYDRYPGSGGDFSI